MTKLEDYKRIFFEMLDLGKDVLPQKFADYKAEDGTVVRTEDEEIKVGSKLTAITAEGVLDIPAEVTEMVLLINDVPTKVMIEGGIVKEIMPVEAPMNEPSMPNEEMSKFDAEASHKGLVERIEKLENALAMSNTALESANNSLATANTQITAQNDLNRKMFALIEQLAGEPAEKPVSKANDKQSFKASKSNFLEEFRKEYNQY